MHNKNKRNAFLKKTLSISLSAVLAISSFSLMGNTGVAKAEAAEVEATAEDEETQGTKLKDSGLDYDYARALQYSMYFYDANMCGTGVSENGQFAWRGNCHTYDAQVPLKPMDEKENGTNLSQEFIDQYKEVLDPDGDGYVDVSGGFHDAGDHVKFGMPENYSAATLGWGYYEFRNSYTKLGQDAHIETLLRYFNDYLMKCTFRDDDGNVIAHCYQVGDGDIDHSYWQSPEVDSMPRPAYFLTVDKPQTDYVVSAAASLTINYLNFKDTDPAYAKKSLDYAKALWDFANSHEKELSDNGDGPKAYYYSNKWEDDYCWAGAWLYKATGDETYLDQVLPLIDYYAPAGWAYCWNDMWSGAITLLGEIDMEHPELDLQNRYREVQGKTQYEDADFWKQIEKAIDTWMTHYTTPGGYAFLNQWGSARYNTAMQMVTLIYEKYHANDGSSQYAKWAESQMQYIMGNNPLDRCYIVGYNEKSAKFPHHRASSGLLMAEDEREQKHVLYGALVGGPDGKDNHIDVTRDYIYNEVTIDYNAAFVGACAGLYEFYGTPDMAVTEDFPPVEIHSGEEGGGNGYWVEAFAVDDLHDDGAGVTKVSLKVMTDAADAKKDISVRYFFNTNEIKDVSSVDAKELYDQASAEEENADGVISGPFKYEGADDIYYVEVKWDGYAIANSGKKYQFSMGMYWGDFWDPTNDYSYQGLPSLMDTDMFGNGNEVKTDYICVYSDGVLVGGIEPDGTKPEGAGENGEDEPAVLEVRGVAVSPTEIFMSEGETQDLKVVVTPLNAKDKTLTWTSDNPDVATVSANGKITAQADGTAVITATAKNGVSGSATVKVSKKDGNTTESGRDDNQGTTTESGRDDNQGTTTESGRDDNQGTTTETGRDDNQGTTTESGRDDNQGTTTESGRDDNQGTTTETGRDDNQGTTTETGRDDNQGTTTETGRDDNQGATTETGRDDNQETTTESGNSGDPGNEKPAEIEVTSIAVSPKSLVLKIGEKKTFETVITPQNATNQTLTWKSNNTNVALVSAKGEVTAIAEGSTVITVKANNGVYTRVSVRVSEDESGTNKDPGNENEQEATTESGKDNESEDKPDPGNENEQEATTESGKDNESEANPDPGKEEDPEKEDESDTNSDTGKEDEQDTTISVIEKISIYPSVLVMKEEEVKALTILVTPQNAANQKLTWISSNPIVAVVSADGKVTAKSEGTADITVRANNGTSSTIQVFVSKKDSDTTNQDTVSNDQGTEVKTETSSGLENGATTGTSQDYEADTEKEKPEKVKGLKKTVVSKYKAKISWKSQTDVNGYEISLYDKKTKKRRTIRIGKKKTYTITKLKSNRKYKIKVRAFYKDGATRVYGAYSKEITFTTK